MVQIIAGNKGKGKTKHLLAMANSAMNEAHGTVVYLDKNSKHMFELNRNIRLINVSEYPVNSTEAFLGFLCGILSQDHDLEVVFLDSFLTLTDVQSAEDLAEIVKDIDIISEKFGVKMVISISMDGEKLPEQLKPMVSLAL
ncbi:MAG: twitching motility protein PilT [Lachnospiraceae bacterium]|nr:twitching motility protein PilT [Lachnospiraceae bacterium]